MSTEGWQEIQTTAQAATRQFEFWQRKSDRALFRRAPEGVTERLVDGRWIDARPPRGWGREDKGQFLAEKALAKHARRYLIAGLAAPGLGWRMNMRERLRRSFAWRWVIPPLEGGAIRRDIDNQTVLRSVQAYLDLVGSPSSEDLCLLREEAAAGHEQQSERCLAVEQRANFFLGASGLTTSLVLANAGVLLGAGKLDAPWLQLAVVSLGVASLCAIVAGFWAMQATMSTFGRIPPNSMAKVSTRSRLSQSEMSRHYIAAHFVSANRESLIANWKISRLSAARGWFLGAMFAIALLTAFVLIAAL